MNTCFYCFRESFFYGSKNFNNDVVTYSKKSKSYPTQLKHVKYIWVKMVFSESRAGVRHLNNQQCFRPYKVHSIFMVILVWVFFRGETFCFKFSLLKLLFKYNLSYNPGGMNEVTGVYCSFILYNVFTQHRGKIKKKSAVETCRAYSNSMLWWRYASY